MRRLKFSQQIKHRLSSGFSTACPFITYRLAFLVSVDTLCVLAVNRCLLVSNELLYVSRTGGRRCVTMATSSVSDLTGNVHSNQA